MSLKVGNNTAAYFNQKITDDLNKPVNKDTLTKIADSIDTANRPQIPARTPNPALSGAAGV